MSERAFARVQVEELEKEREKKEAQLNEVLAASNLDPVMLGNITRKLDEVLDSKNKVRARPPPTLSYPPPPLTPQTSPLPPAPNQSTPPTSITSLGDRPCTVER